MTNDIYALMGNYGQEWAEGILTENLDRALKAGFATMINADGTLHVYDDESGEAVLLVCSELVEVWTEDGRIIGRCGQPAIANATGDWIWCEGHDLPEWGEDCEHGLSLALCAGPGHYPMD